MKLTLFGATGTIGLQLVKQALDAGHRVTLFVRDPAKLDTSHANMKVIRGDILDAASVEKAVRGQDAVLCAVGAGSKGRVRSEGTRHIICAMEQANVKRFICLSTLGVGNSWGNLGFFWKYVMFKGLLRQAYADHVRQESYVKDSHLDWTIVRSGAFTDGSHTGVYRHGFPGTDKTSKLEISRADVADFMLKQLGDETYLHMTPGLAY